MRKFSYVAEFMRKDPKNPKKPLTLERHLFIFVVDGDSEPKPSSRLVKWWDTSNA